MSGVPVVIAANGFGTPVRPVEKNAPVMTVAPNGFGMPIVISDLGVSFIVQGLVWTPADLFKNGEVGAWFDPSDLSTLFQDTAGGVPVTGPGQPVGRILDKSKPLGLDFANPLPNAGIQESGDRTGATWSAVTKKMFLTDVGTLTGYPRFEFKYPTMVIGRTYQIDGRLSGDFGNITQIRLNTIGADNIINLDPITGIMSGVAIAGAAIIQFSFNGRVGATSVVIETLSIREVPGNHASQATVAARPILQRMPKTGRRNLLTETDDLTRLRTY